LAEAANQPARGLSRKELLFWLVSTVFTSTALLLMRLPFTHHPLHDEIRAYFVPIRYTLQAGFGQLFSDAALPYYYGQTRLMPAVLALLGRLLPDEIATYRCAMLIMTAIGATAMGTAVLRRTRSYFAAGLFLALLFSSVAVLPNVGTLLGDGFGLFWLGLFVLSWQSNHWSSAPLAALFAYSRANAVVTLLGFVAARIWLRPQEWDRRSLSLLVGLAVGLGWHAYGAITGPYLGEFGSPSTEMNFSLAYAAETLWQLVRTMFVESGLVIPAALSLLALRKNRDPLVATGWWAMGISLLSHSVIIDSHQRYQLAPFSLWLYAVIVCGYGLGERFSRPQVRYAFLACSIACIYPQWKMHHGYLDVLYKRGQSSAYKRLMQELIEHGFTERIMLPRDPWAWAHRAEFVQPPFEWKPTYSAQRFSVQPGSKYLVLDQEREHHREQRQRLIQAGAKLRHVYSTRDGRFLVYEIRWPKGVR
jgi:hypothetical protein